MFTLGWGDGDGAWADLVDQALQRGAPVDAWRGVREPSRWVVRTVGDALVDSDVAHVFEPLGVWGDDSSAAGPVANFVIRVVAPDAVDDILRQLIEQAEGGEGALAQPGCLGLRLAAAAGRSEMMLGVTSWTTVEAFDGYARWAQAAPWKDVISPVTVDVPLRLLAHRLDLGRSNDG